MGLEQKSVTVAKEADDVLFAVIELVKDLKAGKDLATVAAENLPNLLTALNGVDQVTSEWASSPQAVYSTVGYRVGELVAALTTTPAQPVA